MANWLAPEQSNPNPRAPDTGGTRGFAVSSAPSSPLSGAAKPIEAVIGGRVVQAAGGEFFLSENRYSTTYQRAGHPLHALLAAPAHGAVRAARGGRGRLDRANRHNRGFVRRVSSPAIPAMIGDTSGSTSLRIP